MLDGSRIQAVVEGWKARRKGMILSAEMGTGKTICAIVATHAHANSQPYRALVVCPPHLQHKWVREIQMTLPDAKCQILGGYKDVLGLKRTKPSGPEWLIISGNKAKMASSWIPSFRKKSSGILHCPTCDCSIERKVVHEGAEVMVPSGVADLQKHQTFCKNCSQALFQWTHEYDRWPIANLVSRQARGVFRYLILDEAHEAKGERTSIGLATGKLASAIPYKLALTGTL
ncbi:MAG: SNF2-related protein, partial [Pirellula sp.]